MSDEGKSDGAKKDDVVADEELSKLLDSALQDFNKEDAAKTDKKDDGNKKTDESKGADGDVKDEVEWSDEFIKQAAAQFESNLANLLGSNDGSLSTEQLQQGFQKMAEAASQVLANPTITETSNDFASTISQTLQGLSEGAENLQNPFSEQDLMSAFGQAGDQNAFLPFMQGMMQSLLSKEVLYPSLKDILEKYPGWFQENSSKLTAEELTRYKKQQELMEKVCAQLELESETDSADQKKEQFEKVLSLMQKLQDYGQPPVELVGDVGPGLQFDAQGNPDPSQCSLM